MQAGLSLSLSKRCVEQVPGSHQTHFKIPEEMRRLGANPENLDADWVQGVPARAGDCAPHTSGPGLPSSSTFAPVRSAGILFTEALTHATKPWKLQTDRRTCVPRSPLSCTLSHPH